MYKKFFISGLVIVALLSLAAYFNFKLQHQAKVARIKPDTFLLDKKSVPPVDDSIDPRYSNFKVVNTMDTYYKVKENLENIKKGLSGKDLDMMRYAELRLDKGYNKDQFIKNSIIFLNSSSSITLKSDIVYFVLHDFLESDSLEPTLYVLNNVQDFKKYLDEVSKTTKEYNDFIRNKSSRSYDNKLKIYLALNNAIAKDYPSLASNGTLAHKYIERYLDKNEESDLTNAVENYKKAESLISAKDQVTINDFVVGLNHIAAATVIFRDFNIPTTLDPEELSRNAIYYSNKYKSSYTKMSLFVYAFVLAHNKVVDITELKRVNTILIKNAEFLKNVIKMPNVVGAYLNENDYRLFSLNTLRLMSKDVDMLNFIKENSPEIIKNKI